MEGLLKFVGGLLAVGAVVAGLTVFHGWDEFLDVTGLSDYAPKAVYRAPESECDQIRATYPDRVISCQADKDFSQDARQACAKEGPISPEDFLIGVPGTTKVTPINCPRT